MASAAVAAAEASDIKVPIPPEPLEYPIYFANYHNNDNNSENSDKEIELKVSLFTTLQKLLPIFILSGWIDKKKENSIEAYETTNNANNFDENIPRDVKETLILYPLFGPFLEEKEKIYGDKKLRYIDSFSFPTTKGKRTITRSLIEGDERAHYIHHNNQNGTQNLSVTNTNAVFSLLPQHNQFLLYYESREKLHYFNYVQLDALRFFFVVMQLLITESSNFFNLNDGTLSNLAKRDLKKNNTTEEAEEEEGGDKEKTKASNSNTNNNNSKVGKGNPRLHQGNCGNVITENKTAKLLAEEKKENLQKQKFVENNLEQLCAKKWPYSPFHKSYKCVIEEKNEDELPDEIRQKFTSHFRNNNNKKGKNFKRMYYHGIAEFPLLNNNNNNNTIFRFRSEKWWPSKKEAEVSAGETAVFALQNKIK